MYVHYKSSVLIAKIKKRVNRKFVSIDTCLTPKKPWALVRILLNLLSVIVLTSSVLPSSGEFTWRERAVLKNSTIRRNYNDLIDKGKLKEAKSYLSYEVNILEIHEKNSKSPIPGKRWMCLFLYIVNELILSCVVALIA